jgi:hypothetical protein
MKLSFSFSKTVAPKKQIQVQQEEVSKVNKRQVLTITEGSEIVVEKSAEDAQEAGELVIPVQTLYIKPERSPVDSADPEMRSLSKLENTPGVIAGKKRIVNYSAEETVQKKRPGSILMQIREAREKGRIKDAADVTERVLDPDQFGWALLRGMGYDPSTDTSPDVTKTVVGNRAKIGLGAKLDIVKLPHETKK